MSHYILKLKNILQCKIFLIIVLLFCILYCFICIKFNIFISKYDTLKNYAEGIVEDVKEDETNLSIYVDDLLIYYDNSKNLNILPGDKIKIFGTFNVPDKESNFYSFNYKNYLYSKKIHYIVYASDIEVLENKKNFLYDIKCYMNDRINKYDTKDYLNAFILGDSSLIDDDIKDTYSYNGIIHLFAVSGMHVSLISSVIIYLLNKILKNKKIINIVVISFLIFYCFLANFSVSITRAVLLFILCILNKGLKINIKNYYLLIYLMCMCLFYNPFYIYNIGFQFSYIIAFFLMKFSYIINKSSTYIKKLFTTSLISFISSMPISINTSFSINLLTPLLNILFVPLISFIIFPLSLLCFIFPIIEPIYSFLISIMESLSKFFFTIKCFNVTLCHLSLFSIILYYIIVYFIINKIGLKEYKYIGILFIILLIHHNIRYFDIYSKISFINIGQGDCILITLKHNKANILIDCGEIFSYSKKGYKIKNTGSNVIIPYLKSHGINKLDYVIITHGDFDHIGSISQVIDEIEVNKIILNSGNNNDYENLLINKLKQNKIKYYNLSRGNIRLGKYILNFINEIDTTNENDDSLVIYTKIDGVSILLMGDSGFKTEKYILNTYNIKNVDILKVGHHGSKYSTSEDFVNVINPKYSVISVGKNNKFGHPDKNVISRLADSKVYLTSINGSIEFTLSKKILVKCVR